MKALTWIKQALVPALWKLETQARLETCEAHIEDLRARFTRFQNRENMRRVRDDADRDGDLLEAAHQVLDKQARPPINPEKLELWKARGRRQ